MINDIVYVSDYGLNWVREQCWSSVERDYGLSGTLINNNNNFSDSVVEIDKFEIQ